MTRQDRTVIMVVICVVLAAAGWFLLIKPKRADVADVKTQVEQAQVAADDAAAKAAAAQGARAEYSKDYASVVRLGKAVPVQDDVASLVYQLESTAEDTGVDFRAVTVTEGAAAAPSSESSEGSTESAGTLPGEVTQIPVTLTFDGGYFAMTRFLRQIDRYTLIRKDGDEIDVRGRLLAVNTVKLTPGSKGFPDVQAEVGVTAYRAPLPSVKDDPAAASNGAQPATATGAAADPAASGATPATSSSSSSSPATPSSTPAGGAAQ
ncbi:hypothetical protein LRS13_18330 [Svornostia abyssi]|uniref:Type IV pilus biogenesis protein PilO n=1 Tax=Svornostia abyssi TaxID=2898438 RepID=A0ABY5PDG0_9ACTN|nr:hypothetical protein LRS13_18330 [Parviterribacteraceae bacterium J379]